MSVSQNPEAATILDEIAKLCLNESHSDVSFVVGGEKLPAHRNILCQRCPVLNTIFLKGEPVDELFKLKDAPADALKMFLKFIYTGIVELDAFDVNIIFETAKLARVFEMTKLEEICVDHLKNICAINNVTELVNTTFEKSSELTKFYLEYIALRYEKFVEHKSFKKLSVEVLECLFEAGTLKVSNKIIVDSFLKWMKANPLKSAQFSAPLKHIRLNSKSAQGCVKHLKAVCNIENITDLVNATFDKSSELTKFYLKYIDMHYTIFAKHASFNKLSIKVLLRFFEDFESEAPHDVISKSVVGWMQANPSESAQFPELLKCVSLNAIAFSDLITTVRSLKLIADKDLLDIGCGCIDYEDDDFDDNSTCSEKSFEYPEGNILTPKCDAKVYNGGNYFFFSYPSKGATLKHEIGNDKEYTKIKLPRPCMLNYLEMELTGGDQSYWIEVSEDNYRWTRVIDKSNVVCHGVQKLYFEERPVCYIGIHGTAPADGTFEISRIEAYYTEDSLDVDPKTDIAIPADNVVVPGKDAIIPLKNAQDGVVDNAKNAKSSTFEISRPEACYTEKPLYDESDTGSVTSSDNVALPKKNAITLQGTNENAQDSISDSAKNDRISTYPEVGISCSIM